jgi:hypothetical protein
MAWSMGIECQRLAGARPQFGTIEKMVQDSAKECTAGTVFTLL